MASPSRAAARRRRPDRAQVVRTAYRLGWRHGGRLPQPLVRAVGALAARVVVARGGPHVGHLRRNLTVLAGRPADAALLRAGIASYVRTFWEVLALPRWSRADVLARIELVDEPGSATRSRRPGRSSRSRTAATGTSPARGPA